MKLKTPTLGKIKIGNLMHGAIASIKKKKRKTMDNFKTRMESATALVEEADQLDEGFVGGRFAGTSDNPMINAMDEVKSKVSMLSGWKVHERGTMIGPDKDTIDPRVVKILKGAGFKQVKNRMLGKSELWNFEFKKGKDVLYAQYTNAPLSSGHSLYLTRYPHELH